MEYDWFWVILAIGVLTMVAIVPLQLALMLIGAGANPAGTSVNVRAGRPL